MREFFHHYRGVFVLVAIFAAVVFHQRMSVRPADVLKEVKQLRTEVEQLKRQVTKHTDQ